MKKILLLIFISMMGISQGQIIIEDPIVDVGNLWSFHQIESFHFTSHGGFAFLNDGSSWKIDPSDRSWVEENSEILLNTPITLMPDAGTEKYPLRMVVHGEQNTGWKDFTVQFLSAPNDQDASIISEIDLMLGNFLILTIPLESEIIRLPLLINPHDVTTLKKWKKGQKVIIGGVWLPEYDFNEHKDYNSAYQYVLYNYFTGNYVFFSVLPEDEE